MSGTQTYHGLLQQPYRIQKRLVLNQCFKTIATNDTVGRTLNYVTFGGEDLYDVMDLIAVFDIRHLELRVLSYEQDDSVALKSRTCAVAANLSRVETVSVEIVSSSFGDDHSPIHTIRDEGSFIYFLDDTRTFREPQAEVLFDLLRSDLLREGDYFLITSCLTPRVVNQPSFMRRYEGTYRTFFGADIKITQEFKVRNHVDLLVAQTLSRFQGVRSASQRFLRPRLWRKFKYSDTKAAMGLWLFQLQGTADRMFAVKDVEFEEFPHAFNRLPVIDDIPDIFDRIVSPRR